MTLDRSAFDPARPPSRGRRLVAAAALLVAAAVSASAEDDSPKVRSVKPEGAVRGSAVDIVVEGKFLFPLEDVIVDRNDVVVNVAGVGNSPTRLLLKATIAETAPAGPVKISIRTKSGTVVTEKFSVRLRVPTVAKVVPSALARGKEYDLTIHGTHLALPAAETKVTIPAPMTIVKDPRKSDAKTIVAKVVVPATAPLGAHAIGIETGDGKVSVGFTVVASPPSVTRVDPPRVARDAAATLTLSGTNLAGAGVTLAVPDPAIRIEPAAAGDATTLPLRLKVDPTAQPGPRTLLVTTGDGTTSATFEVGVDPPVLARLTPPSAARGTSVELSLEGTRIPAGASPRFAPADPALRLEPSGAGRPVRVTVDPSAVPGPRTVIVPTRDGTLTATFQVTLRPPHVAGLAPQEVAPGSTTEVTVDGQHLSGCTWSVAPPDPAVTVEAIAADRLRVVALPGAKPGPRYLAARNADGAALGILAVSGSAAVAPVVTSIAPARVTRPGSTPVTVKGLNLLETGGRHPRVRVDGAEGVAIPAEVTSSTTSSVGLTVGLTAATKPGTYLVTVETAEGGAAAILLVSPSSPTIASVTPQRVSRPATVEVTLAGTGLVDPAGAPAQLVVARADGSGIVDAKDAKVIDASATALRFRLVLAADALPGDLVATVTTSDGGAAAVLTIEGRPPSITALAPRRVGVPATADLAIEGENLLSPDGKPPLIAVTRVGSAAAIRPLVVNAGNTAMTVRISTPPGTPAGPHVLSLRTADGAAAALFEVVDAPPPVVTAIEPDAGGRGTTVLARVRGSGLRGTTSITFDGEGTNVTILPGGDDRELHLKIIVAPEALPGPRAFTVTGAGGASPSGKVVFTVR